MSPLLVFAQKDTLDFYYRLENRADKHKITSWMYDAIFTDLDNVSEQDTTIFVKKDKTINQFLQYKGKIIRKISIVTLDPFGYSVNDTCCRNISSLERAGNRYHMTTRHRVVRNILQFEANSELDPLELSESERLLRLSPYVNDARIYIKNISRKKADRDSVDVLVIVHDKWSTLAGSRFDVKKPDIQLIERNLFGIGHQLEEDIEWDNSKAYLGTSGRYSIFNIQNTFISTSIFYSKLEDLTQTGFSIDRPFYSSLAKWAGGLSMSHSDDTYIVTNPDSKLETRYQLDYNTQDVWAAKNVHFSDKITSSIAHRTKSFTIGGRYYHNNFLKRPSLVTIDTNRINRDQHLYLANAGFSQRKFYRDRYLYRFGANEDIPEGFLVEYTQGLRQKELSSLWYYSGVRAAAGKHFYFGYLSGGMGYGTFYDKTFTGSGILSADCFYFTDLIKGGKWFFREFSHIELIHGIDRESYENTTLNGKQMYGFSSDQLMNKSKLVLNFEFVMYAPYEVLGFKFAPVLFCGLGRIGNNLSDMTDGRLYQSYALGLLIRNEHLITNTFEISIGLYPFMPGSSDNTIKFNPVGSYTLRARDYLISKPDIINYTAE
jgi:hypothetical protein